VSGRAVLAVVAGALALAVAGIGSAAAPPTLTPGTLTVGLAMPSEGFQVGIVKGPEVVYAQGFEIDLARALTLRMGLPDTVFVQNRFDRLYSAGAKLFDVGIGEISITPARKKTVAFSIPYMSVDQGVLASQTLTPLPKTIAGLQALNVCALAKTTGADLARTRIAPVKPVLAVGNVPTLMLNLQTGRCDRRRLRRARARDAEGARTGPVRGVRRRDQDRRAVRHLDAEGVAAPRAGEQGTHLSPLRRELRGLARQWLTFDPAKARVLG
jgi:hypothetical protein